MIETKDIFTISLSCAALCLSLYNFYRSRLDLRLKRFSEIHDWHNRCVQTLMQLKLNDADDPKQKEILALLSSLIEEGRFYFPNIMIDASTDNHKPRPYRGLRHNCLDFLVFAYEIVNQTPENYNRNALEELQREFTGVVFDTLKPYQLIQTINRHSGNKYYKPISFEDFIANSH